MMNRITAPHVLSVLTAGLITVLAFLAQPTAMAGWGYAAIFGATGAVAFLLTLSQREKHPKDRRLLLAAQGGNSIFVTAMLLSAFVSFEVPEYLLLPAVVCLLAVAPMVLILGRRKRMREKISDPSRTTASRFATFVSNRGNQVAAATSLGFLLINAKLHNDPLVTGVAVFLALCATLVAICLGRVITRGSYGWVFPLVTLALALAWNIAFSFTLLSTFNETIEISTFAAYAPAIVGILGSCLLAWRARKPDFKPSAFIY